MVAWFGNLPLIEESLVSINCFVAIRSEAHARPLALPPARFMSLVIHANECILPPLGKFNDKFLVAQIARVETLQFVLVNNRVERGRLPFALFF